MSRARALHRALRPLASPLGASAPVASPARVAFADAARSYSARRATAVPSVVARPVACARAWTFSSARALARSDARSRLRASPLRGRLPRARRRTRSRQRRDASWTSSPTPCTATRRCLCAARLQRQRRAREVPPRPPLSRRGPRRARREHHRRRRAPPFRHRGQRPRHDARRPRRHPAIGTSGSKAFVDHLTHTDATHGDDESVAGESAPKESSTDAAAANIIGKFGVGFYSAFMVSDRVDVFSSAGDGRAPME